MSFVIPLINITFINDFWFGGTLKHNSCINCDLCELGLGGGHLFLRFLNGRNISLVFDKGNFVVLMKSSILGKSDSPNELVSLACTFTA